MRSWLGRLKRFDAYTKPAEDFRIKTFTGGAVSIACFLLILTLFMSELQNYLTMELHEEILVDTSKDDDDRVKINFDVTFARMGCQFTSVDAMDVSGESQSDVQHNVWKVKLDRTGKPLAESPQKHEVGAGAVTSPTTPKRPNDCGSCYGAENDQIKCCNTCQDVKDAYRLMGWAVIESDQIEQCRGEGWAALMKAHEAEGCRIYGYIKVAKVEGNFHIAPGESLKSEHAHVHDLHMIRPNRFNTTHVINHLSFGDAYPGKEYPLDRHQSLAITGGVMFQYFVKIVPTEYAALNNKSVKAHQFSVTKHQRIIKPVGGGGLPGLFLVYDFAPVMVRYTEQNRSFTHFLTSVCTIVGGVFTVASLIDAFLYHSSRALQQKMAIGKLS